MNWFRYKDVIAEFPDKDRSYLSRALATMISQGMLLKISRDLYNIIPLSTDVDTYVPDSRLIARGVMSGNELQFVLQSSGRFFGFKAMWVTDHEQIMVSDMEKTLVDAVASPILCGGITMVAKAILLSKHSADLETLFNYFARNGCNAAKKRYLFLADLPGLSWSSDHERMLQNSGASISLLDPAGSDRGRKNSRFGLKVNMDVYALQNSVLES